MKKLALLGNEPIRKEPYPSWPEHDQRDIDAVTRVVQSGYWGGYPYPGPETKALLTEFMALQGGAHAVACTNGTVTMEVALRAAGIGWGDEVIIPAYTFQGTVAPVLTAGAVPVIVDIDPERYCLSPEAVQNAISPRTKAIIPVHLGGQMADMDALVALANEYDLTVIEDCAHAHGAHWRGRGAGTWGHFGSFSLQTSKTIAAGEGGILLCRSQEMAYRAASIVDCGRAHDPEGTLFTLGSDYRMSELHAALARVAVQRFPEQARQREEMALYLEESLSEVPGVRLLSRDVRHDRRSFYRYIFAIEPEIFGIDHELLCRALAAEGIPADAGYPSMHRYELFQPELSNLPAARAFAEQLQLQELSFPAAEAAASREAVWLDEAVLRAGKQGVDDVVAALTLIHEHREQLAKWVVDSHG